MNFDSDARADRNKNRVTMPVSPIAMSAMPVAIAVVMPVSIIPVVVMTILVITSISVVIIIVVSASDERGTNDRTK